MDIVTIKGVAHNIFEDEIEFINWHLDNKLEVPELIYDWHLAEEGDWVVGDDKKVVQVIKSNKMYDKRVGKKIGWVRTCLATFVQRKDKYLDSDVTIKRSRFVFSQNRRMKRHKDRLARERLSHRDIQFLALLKSGILPQDAYITVFGSTAKTYKSVQALLKTKRIQMALNQNLEKICEDAGVSYEYIVAGYKKIAEETDSDAARLTSLTKLKEFVDDAVKRAEAGEIHRDALPVVNLEMIEEDRAKALSEAGDD